MTHPLLAALVVFVGALIFHRATPPAGPPRRGRLLVDVALSLAAALVAGAGTAIFETGVS